MPAVPSHRPIALFAGRGDLPHTLIQIFQKQKRPFVILAFRGQTEKALVNHLPHLWLSFGEAGKALRYMEENHVKEIVMAGAVSRPTLSEIRPDWEGVKWLAKIGSKALGDDNLLKLIIEMMEKKGYAVVGPDDILEDILAPLGPLTALQPDDQAWRDIARGLEVLCALSPVDVGQAVVIQEGLVLGIEAIEGTDALLERVGPLHRPGPGGILIKTAKHQQEQRVDLPTIGQTTIHKALQAGLQGIAVEAGRTLFLNREETLKLAQENGLFIVGLDSPQCHTFL
ncbi:MAG: UDP-2,3-diacylglucosamine diphosphatase LpxI [Alphaproteobacteria bacterium]|nr:UDP-2,3-diacylglucosamine diphosphatase LpxI [Alphaproteobacteria bacterium]